MPELSFCSAAWLLFTGNDSSCGCSWMAVAGSSSRAQGSSLWLLGMADLGAEAADMLLGLGCVQCTAAGQSAACGICCSALHSVGCGEAGASRRLGAGGFAITCCLADCFETAVQHSMLHHNDVEIALCLQVEPLASCGCCKAYVALMSSAHRQGH